MIDLHTLLNSLPEKSNTWELLVLSYNKKYFRVVRPHHCSLQKDALVKTHVCIKELFIMLETRLERPFVKNFDYSV